MQIITLPGNYGSGINSQLEQIIGVSKLRAQIIDVRFTSRIEAAGMTFPTGRFVLENSEIRYVLHCPSRVNCHGL